MGRKPEEITVWKIDRRRSNLVEYDASSDGELFQLSERERERRFPWKRALRSSKRRGEIGRRSLETMRGWTNGNHLSLRSSFLFLRSSTMQTWTLHGEILKKRKRKKKGGRIFELVERIIVLIFAILFFVEKFGI